MENVREEWITWRCKQVHAFLTELRDILVSTRKDLRLVFSCWPWYIRPGGRGPKHEHQLGIQKSTYEIHREGGFDWKMFFNEPNIDLEIQFTPQHKYQAGRGTPPPELAYFRDLDFLDKETLSCFHHPPKNACFLYNGYFETFRVSNPLPDWWFGKEMLNHPGMLLGHKYFMEHYAQVVSALDARTITRGGYSMSTIGHDDAIREFAKAYRSLPAEGFSDVPVNTDIVCVRHALMKKYYYIYLINREFETTQVTLTFARMPKGLLNIPEQKVVPVRSRSVSISLSPYQLIALRLPENGPGLKKVEAEIPSEVVKWVETKLQRLKKSAPAVPEEVCNQASIRKILAEVERAIAEKRYFHANHLLNSYTVQRMLRY